MKNSSFKKNTEVGGWCWQWEKLLLMLLVLPASYYGFCSVSWLLHFQHSFLPMAQGSSRGWLESMWVLQKRVLAPGFSGSAPAVMAIWGVSQRMEGLCLPLWHWLSHNWEFHWGSCNDFCCTTGGGGWTTQPVSFSPQSRFALGHPCKLSQRALVPTSSVCYSGHEADPTVISA